MTETPHQRTLKITINFEDVKDAKFILNNLSTVILNKADYESKHLSAKIKIKNVNHLPFQEPRFEEINGEKCMVFKSSI
jgi:hypothetical protein